MGEIQACLGKLRLPITAGHRARLAAAQTDRCPQDQLIRSFADCCARQSMSMLCCVCTLTFMTCFFWMLLAEQQQLEEIIWLNSSLDCTEEDFAQALSDLLLQDARLEAMLWD